jgi:NitT/TauT family transport system permease protein
MATVKALWPISNQYEKARRWRQGGAFLLGGVALGVGWLAWELLVRANHYPAFILPLPGAVLGRFWAVLADGSLARHTLTTLIEIGLGFALGASAAMGLGYGIAKSPLLENLLTPYIVASQAIPVVAIAPLLVIWFGFGLPSKIIIGALIVFFPILINTIYGVRAIEPDLRDLMRALRATRWQTFTKLELPAALPVLLNGLKVGATLSVIGAVVGEFVGAQAGLGFFINEARGRYDTALVLVAVAMLVGIAVALYAGVSMLERVLVKWKA